MPFNARSTILTCAFISTALASVIPDGLAARQATLTPAPTGASSTAAPAAATVITTDAYGRGVTDVSYSIQSRIPMACLDGCHDTVAPFGYCFGNYAYLNGTVLRPAESDCTSLCNQARYDRYTACLNCIVANGNERAPGFNPNNATAATTATGAAALFPSNLPDSVRNTIPINANGFIDASQANAALANVTAYCGARGVQLERQGNVTAVPTTTGPYSSSWASGQTINRPTWTGLTQYGPANATLTFTRPPGADATGNNAQNSSTTAPAAAGQSSRAAGMRGLEQGAASAGILGVFMAWALL